MKKNYGFKPDIIKTEDFFLGSLEQEVIREDGQWDNFLPPEEFQATEVESMACVSFGTLNALETLLKAQGVEDNFSDRWLAWNSGTSKQGNSPQTVAETLRKAGVPKEEKWPINAEIDTWEDFYANPPPKLFETARDEFIEPYEFFHEWVSIDEASLIRALKLSPLGVAVYAWQMSGGKYVRPSGAASNHWTMLYGYEVGKFWKVFDSYDNSRKKLAWDFRFDFPKRYLIKKKPVIQDDFRGNWFADIIAAVARFFNSLIFWR